MSALAVKWIAVICMLIDHVGFLYGYAPLRYIGRIAMPLFAFLIANGYQHTKSVPKYAARLAAFAVISEIPFDLFVSGKVSYFRMANRFPIPIPKLDNVYFTLLFGLLFLWVRDVWKRKAPKAEPFLSLCTFFALGISAQICDTDYGLIGVGMIAVFGCFDAKTQKGMLIPAFSLVMIWRALGKSITAALLNLGIACTSIPLWATVIGSGKIGAMDKREIVGILALIPIFLYNGKSGMPVRGWQRKVLQYGFYAFYPLHLLVLYWIGCA